MAVFYAVDLLVRYAQVPGFDEKAVVSLVTACFITPFLLFSSFAGVLGDRFSKRNVIVFWKVAEVGMMSLALFGLSLPHLAGEGSTRLPMIATWSAGLVVFSVFLMGTHSTFFVPAKLGVMPELMHPSVLSRANGLLEGTSFMAQILGTSFGGMLYALVKGEVIAGNPGQLRLGQEWIIGVVLVGLSLLGTVTAVIMQPVPPAAPDKPVSWSWWAPLRENLEIVFRSRPLTLAATGIAFCVFMTLFLRQTLLLKGEMDKELNTARVERMEQNRPSSIDFEGSDDAVLRGWFPPRLVHALREPELRVSMLFVLVGLGVGVGSLAAGYLSGHRVELGLVPLGGVLIVLGTVVPSVAIASPWFFAPCLFTIGVGAGFYLVPMYTLLQQRAPKTAKSKVIAASNFINVAGGIGAVAIFFAVAGLLDRIFGVQITEAQAIQDPSLMTDRISQLIRQSAIPRLLFLTAALLTLLAIWLLTRRMPDFLFRAAIWLRSAGHNRLRVAGAEYLPLAGPTLLVTNTGSLTSICDLVAGLDRHCQFLLPQPTPAESSPAWLLAVAKRAGVRLLPRLFSASDWQSARSDALSALGRGDVIAVRVNGLTSEEREAMRQLLDDARKVAGLSVVPVQRLAENELGAGEPRFPQLVLGEPLQGQFDMVELESQVSSLWQRRTHS
ncbi:MAG: MFS transporter, partial [Planctomycetaceae bacterium]